MFCVSFTTPKAPDALKIEFIKKHKKKTVISSCSTNQGQMKVRIARIEESLDLIMEIMQSRRPAVERN